MDYEDINMSAKQLFEKVMENRQELLKNKFFIMEVITIDDITDTHNFYTIRTDLDCKITEIVIAGPNSLDTNMLIDAIVGCKPNNEISKLKFSNALVYMNKEIRGQGWQWVPDIKERLAKMNVLRLKEIYKKLKS
jgi:hypothetical protein